MTKFAPKRVLYVQYTNPAGYPPVDHSAVLLAEAGFEVLLLGTRDPQDPLRLSPHPGVQARFMLQGRKGWRQKVHYGLFAFWVAWWTLAWRPAWVYASDPLSCPLVLGLKVLLRRQLIYHEHDAPASDAGRGESAFVRMVLRARRAVARRADLCVVPNEARTAAFRQATGSDRVITVWNCPTSQEAVERRTPSLEDGLRLFYHGSIVPVRLPTSVLEALAKLPQQVSLLIAGYETVGHPKYASALLRTASQLGIAHRVQLLGPVAYREDLLKACATCHVGLSLLPRATSDVNETAMFGASNKVFDYMACGLAVLISDLPVWRPAIVAGGFGRSCDPASVDSVADALRWFLDHPVETAAMGQLGRRKIAGDWNYERAFAPVLASMTFPSEPVRRAEAGRVESSA